MKVNRAVAKQKKVKLRTFFFYFERKEIDFKLTCNYSLFLIPLQHTSCTSKLIKYLQFLLSNN